mmetsp:Transcript_10300/g.14128  ORF Transcript_10300/g.14128 Transcript_10300/m.14128 type:complete len:90 (+) Transcript_10300:1527-1796(+)
MEIRNGKDIIFWVRKEQTIPDFDWDCPCLAPVKTGPCGEMLIQTMKCTLDKLRKDDPNMDCEIPKLTHCMKQYPEQYADFLKIFDADRV